MVERDPAILAVPTRYTATSGISSGTILALDQDRYRWISKRYDRFRLLEDSTIARCSELHLDLRTSNLSTSPLASSGVVLLPIMRIGRERYADVEIVDCGGDRLPRPGSRLERRIVAEGIAELVSTNRAAAEVVTRIDLVERLVPLLEMRPPGQPTFSNVNSFDVRMARRVHGVAARYLGLPHLSEESTNEELYRTLEKSGLGARICLEIATQLERYQCGEILLVSVSADAINEPLVLTVNHREQLPKRGLGSRARRVLLGTMSLAAQVDVPGVNESSTFHAIAEAPVGFRVVDVAMAVRQEYPLNEPRSFLEDTRWEYDDDPLSTRSHVAFSRRPESSFCDGQLYMSFYADKSGLFTEGVFAALLASTLFAFFTGVLHLSNFEFSVFSKTSQADIVSSIVFFVPGLFVARMLSKDNHRAADQAFALNKALLAAIGCTSLAASLPLAVDLGGKIASTWWYVTAGLCWILSLRIVLGSLLHAWRISSVRRHFESVRRMLSA